MGGGSMRTIGTDVLDRHHHHDAALTELDDAQLVANGTSTLNAADLRGIKRQAVDYDDDDDDKLGARERRKIEIKFIEDKSRRHITFSKRKAGIMKKAYELSILTGTQVLLLVVSETGLVYTFTTPKLQPLVTKAEGKNLIQACLNAPEPVTGLENGVDHHVQESPEDTTSPQQHLPPQPTRSGITPQTPHIGPNYLPLDPSQLAYQTYLQNRGSPFGMPPQPGMPQHASH